MDDVVIDDDGGSAHRCVSCCRRSTFGLDEGITLVADGWNAQAPHGSVKCKDDDFVVETMIAATARNVLDGRLHIHEFMAVLEPRTSS